MRLGTPLLILALAGSVAAEEPQDAGTFFDDFSYGDTAALARNGWIVRSAAGLPGIAGASWGEGSVVMADDPLRPGNRVLRMVAGSDGTPAGTRQAQLCHERKYLEGTYAARVRFSDTPVFGPDVDQMVLTFYTLSAYVRDLDPLYSELDFEYLPNGGWGSRGPTMVNTSWETFQMEPWRALNQQNRRSGSQAGWHTLVTQVSQGKVRYFLDGVRIAEHGGKNYPRLPMSINFNLWFIQKGWSREKTARLWSEDVDWVFHARNRVLSPAEVEAQVEALRQAGTSHADTVPPASPPLPCLCNL
jgi:hypothetical protein